MGERGRKLPAPLGYGNAVCVVCAIGGADQGPLTFGPPFHDVVVEYIHAACEPGEGGSGFGKKFCVKTVCCRGCDIPELVARAIGAGG